MEEIRILSIRIPKELWKFLKRESLEKEISMNGIIINCLEKYRSRVKKKLTEDNTVVS